MGRGSDETHTAPAKARSGLMYGSARRAQKLDVADLRAIQFWSMNDPDGSFEAAEEIAAEIRDRIGNWHPQHIGDILEPLAKYAPASVITDDKPKEYPTGMQSVSYALCVFMFDEVMVDHAVRWSQSFKAKYGCGPQERTVRLLVSGMRRRQMFGGEQEPVMILRNGLTEEGDPCPSRQNDSSCRGNTVGSFSNQEPQESVGSDGLQADGSANREPVDGDLREVHQPYEMRKRDDLCCACRPRTHPSADTTRVIRRAPDPTETQL
jgi:hypothetical protein